MHRVDGLGSDVSKYRVTISRPAADGSPPKNGTRPASARRDRATARSPWSCPPRLRTCAPSVPRGPLRALPSQVRGPVPPLLRHLSTPRFVSPHSPKFDVCGDTNTGVLGPRGETAVVGGVVSRETAPRSFGQGSAPVDRLTGEWGMGWGRFRTSGPYPQQSCDLNSAGVGHSQRCGPIETLGILTIDEPARHAGRAL